MSTTAQQALDLAIQRSSLNNPDLVAPAQAVRYIANAEKAAYLLAAKLNPEYFGKNADTSTRSAFVDSWDLSTTPGGIASVTRAEVKTITGTVTNDGVDIVIGDKIHVTVLEVKGDRIKLGFEAPKSIPIHRAEVLRQIAEFEPEFPCGEGKPRKRLGVNSRNCRVSDREKICTATRIGAK